VDESFEQSPPEDDAFAETVLEDPAKALAEARGQAAQASAESTEHAAPVSRQQPPIQPPADQVPPAPSAPPQQVAPPMTNPGSVDGDGAGPAGPEAPQNPGTDLPEDGDGSPAR
jgi:hypothetical protein